MQIQIEAHNRRIHMIAITVKAGLAMIIGFMTPVSLSHEAFWIGWAFLMALIVIG